MFILTHRYSISELDHAAELRGIKPREIELFFKAIKQNLKIKRFYGTSRNAVYTQIWIALIAYLLFSILKFTTNAKRTFTCFASVFPTVLFQRRSLQDWFMDTSQSLTDEPETFGQLKLI